MVAIRMAAERHPVTAAVPRIGDLVLVLLQSFFERVKTFIASTIRRLFVEHSSRAVIDAVAECSAARATPATYLQAG
jgi:hypothetical protein